jgi:hypothetical protein
MNKDELQREAHRLGIRLDAFSLDNADANEAYVLAFDGRGWRVYYSQRGQESGVRQFDGESEACDYLLQLLLRDSSTRVSGP